MVFHVGVLTEHLLLFFRPSKAFFPAIFYFHVLSIVLLPHRNIPFGIHISQRPEENRELLSAYSGIKMDAAEFAVCRIID